MLLCDVSLAVGATALHVTVVSDDMFHIQLRLGDNLWGQNECYNIGMSIARMTSQIRP